MVTDDDSLGEAIARILEHGPMPMNELVAQLVAGGLVRPVGDEEADDPFDVVSDEIMRTKHCWSTETGVVGRTDLLLDGTVFTHRLNAEELASQRVQRCPDLVVVGWDAGPDELRLTGGDRLSIEWGERVPGEDHSSFCGPSGWLGRAGAGDLLGFFIQGGEASVRVIDALESADQREVEALRRGIESWLPSGQGSELDPIAIEALLLDPDIFRRPVRPLGELAAAAGLSRRGFSFGRSSEHWSTAAERYEADRRQAASEGLALCCRRHFEALCDALVAYRGGEAIEPRAVLNDLDHGDVPAAFAMYAPEYEELGAFARTLAEVAPSEAPVQLLLGLTADVNGHPAEADAWYRAALETDPQLTPAAEALASCEIVRGHFDRALALLSGPGMDPDGDIRNLLEDLLTTPAPYAGTGRNEPCPCGSGKKYKQCHLGRGPRWMEDPVDRLSVKMALDAERRAAFFDILHSLTAVAYSAHGFGATRDLASFLDDPVLFDLATVEGGLAEQYLEERGALLPDDERDVLRAMIEEPRRLFEILDRSGEVLRVRASDQSADGILVLSGGSLPEATRGEFVVARMLDVAGVPSMVGDPIVVPAAEAERVRALLEHEPGAAELAAWYGELCRDQRGAAPSEHFS